MSHGEPIRFAILVSGGGTNLQALLDFWRRVPLDEATTRSVPAVVISNRPKARALERARAADVPTEVVSHLAHPSREAFERALVEVLDRYDVEWIVLAGFMRVLTPLFVGRYRDRILNTHPALLPSFPGVDGAAQAVAAGVKISGCTIHLVDEGVDTGPILAQAAVPVLSTDTPAELQARIQRVEHALYPKVVAKMLAGRFQREGRTITLEGGGP